jgi:hypothetical protein
MGRLDQALRRRALHPRQAHVEAGRQTEAAAFGTEINLGVDRVIGRPGCSSVPSCLSPDGNAV